jgi:glyoxylase-like metal-dependent hydrolase (beta-lactamase superfamily II)
MPTEIVAGVYDITCRLEDSGKRYRVFLFTDRTPTLVDTGLQGTTDAVIERIAEIGIEPERLIVTHGDADHIGGFDALVNEYGLETWVPEQTNVTTESVPDHRYTDGDEIGGFSAVHIPGHRQDNHVLIDETAGIAVMGDAVSGADQRGLPVGYFHLPPAVYSEDLNEAERNLEDLLDYEFEVGLVYHGSSVTDAASEKLHRYVEFPGKPD